MHVMARLVASNSADRHVGGKIREARQLRKMSQERLGELLGITFQQVQKYERGINRVSAGRLRDIGIALSVPITFFYNGLEEFGDPHGFAPLLQSSEGERLARAFSKLPKDMRRAVADFVEEIASHIPGGDVAALTEARNSKANQKSRVKLLLKEER